MSEAEVVTLGSSYDDDSASQSQSMSASGSTGQSGREASTVPTSTTLGSSVMLAHPTEREGEVTTPMASPERKKRVEFNQQQPSNLDDQYTIAGVEKTTIRRRPVTPRHQHLISEPEDEEQTPRQSMYLPTEEMPPPPKQHKHPRRQAINHPPLPPTSVPPGLPRTSSDLSISDLLPSYPFAEGAAGSSSGGILEQAWMTKMAREIARRVEEERERADRQRVESSSEKTRLESAGRAEEAPPAYQQ